MFFNSNEVLKLVTCQVCHNTFDDPRMLPCGHTFCASCIKRACLTSGEESSNIKCRSCGRKDLVNVEKLPVNEVAYQLIGLKPSEINQGESIKDLRHKQKLLSERVDQFKKSVYIGIDEVKNHCAKIKLEIDLQTESRIEELRSISEQMKREIDDYERECVEEYDAEKVKHENEKVLAKYDQLKSETSTYLERFNMTGNETIKLIAKHQQVYDEIEVNQTFLQAHKFNSKMIKFEKSDQAFEREGAIGKIKLEKFNTDLLNLEDKMEIFAYLPKSPDSSTPHMVKSRVKEGHYFALFLDLSNRMTLASIDSGGQMIYKNLLTHGSRWLLPGFLAETNDGLIISMLNQCAIGLEQTILNQTIKLSEEEIQVLVKVNHDLNYIKHVTSDEFSYMLATNSSTIFSVDESRIVAYSFDLERQYELAIYDDLIPNDPRHFQCNDKKAFILYTNAEIGRTGLRAVDLDSKTVDQDIDLAAWSLTQVKLIGDRFLAIYDEDFWTLSIYCQTNLLLINKIELELPTGEYLLSNDASVTELCLVDKSGKVLVGKLRIGLVEEDASVNTSDRVSPVQEKSDTTGETPKPTSL